MRWGCLVEKLLRGRPLVTLQAGIFAILPVLQCLGQCFFFFFFKCISLTTYIKIYRGELAKNADSEPLEFCLMKLSIFNEFSSGLLFHYVIFEQTTHLHGTKLSKYKKCMERKCLSHPCQQLPCSDISPPLPAIQT